MLVFFSHGNRAPREETFDLKQETAVIVVHPERRQTHRKKDSNSNGNHSTRKEPAPTNRNVSIHFRLLLAESGGI